MTRKNQKQYNYLDRALIRLKRTYGKDEVVSALSKKLKDTELELGKSIAYINELEHEKKCFKQYKYLEKEAKLDELYLMRSNENSRLNSELKKIRKANKELVHSLFILKNK